MRKSRLTLRAAAIVAASLTIVCGRAEAVVVGGGGSKATDCMAVFDAPGANSPAPPKAAKQIVCTDGDSSCDADATRNGRCLFDLQVCLNSSAISGCNPDTTNTAAVAHAEDNANDSKFDPDFQGVQVRIDQLGLPGDDLTDDCTVSTTITVELRASGTSGLYKRARKKLSMSSTGLVGGHAASDRDKLKMTCVPEGNGIYTPTELYDGTFDRIRHEIFAQSCALSSCHDSEAAQAMLILLPNVAYSQTVGVTPSYSPAANAGLLRITPGDPDMSLLYRKIEHTADSAGFGPDMPLQKKQLPASMIELVRLWIIGDGTLGPAPKDGWVVGTDQ